MDKKFSSLRFKEFAKAAAAGAIVGALALHPVAADANTGSVEIHAGNATWFVNTDITFSTTSSGGLALLEATVHTAVTTRNDAFDGALTWHVNASPPGDLKVGQYRSPGGTVDVTANSVIGTTQVMVGLNVHAELFFTSPKAVVRSMLILQNPTASPVTVTVDNDTNKGSDDATAFQAFSDGGSSFDAADNWAISCQDLGGNVNVCDDTLDPVLTFAFSQANAPVRPTAINSIGNGTDRQFLRYTVTVPAGATRRVVIFAQLSDTAAHAEADALLFNTNDSLQSSGYFAGLSQQVESEIVNWTIGTVPAPTLSEWAKIGMGLMLGLAGLFSIGLFRRRQRGAGAS
jgi:hypothetical protein